ncbi:hypothetical protein CPLU01_03586 [Colletotrichum plurivorum]|uniref:Uncharacterized protein n=1 Tax=Colletotrichum plurivorum TaxID=2175906 RepID=A0A8H6NL78_9PEZI|nr:hypothetical protein CPLU01_03586 [Colletotrichum plurivorum]
MGANLSVSSDSDKDPRSIHTLTSQLDNQLYSHIVDRRSQKEDLQIPLLEWAIIGSIASSFGQGAVGLLPLLQTLSGLTAHRELVKLGGEIQKSVEQMAHSADSLNSQQNQNSDFFPQHVHDFVSMCIDEAQATGGSDGYFFVYHPGTDWHVAFKRHLKASPLDRFCGCFSSVAAMGLFLERFRAAVGPGPTIHVLVPAVHLFLVPGKFEIPEAFYPMCVRGELHQSGRPYVHLNIANLPPSQEASLQNVANIGRRSTWRRKVYSVSRATAAGAPAAGGGLVAGIIVGGLLPVAFPPLLPFAAAGVKVRKKSEKTWDERFGENKGTLTGMGLFGRKG